MRKYLLDTCILSEYVKKVPNKKVITWIDNLNENNLFISILTLGELEKGAIKQKSVNMNRYHKLILWVDMVETRFSDNILSIDNKVIKIWASLCGVSESKGVTLPVIDSLIAATAASHNLEIITRNTSDFSFYPKVLNPWNI